MSEKRNLPEQLILPFPCDDAPRHSATVLFLCDHRSRASERPESQSAIPKDAEKRILDRVLERADGLSWYK